MIPTSIKPVDTFVEISADNNDLNEETIDGKNATHATTMVIYQKKTFDGPDPPPPPPHPHNPVEHRASGVHYRQPAPCTSLRSALFEENVHLLLITLVLLTLSGTRMRTMKYAPLVTLISSGLFFAFVPRNLGELPSQKYWTSKRFQAGH